MGGSGPADLAWCTRKLGDDVLHLHRAQLWVLHNRDGLARLEVRISKNARDVIHWHDGALILIEPFQYLFGCAFADPTADNSIDLIDVRDTGAVVFEARIVDQLGLADGSKYPPR